MNEHKMIYDEKYEERIKKLERALDAVVINGGVHEDLITFCLKNLFSLESNFSDFKKKYREEKNELEKKND